MRHILSLSFCLSLGAFLLLTPQAQAAECDHSTAGDHSCEAGATPPQKALPVTTPGTPAARPDAPTPALGTGEPVDYSNASESLKKHVQPNLTQESGKLAAASCNTRSIPAGSTTAVPFVFDGNTSFTVAPGQGPVRTFVTSAPGFDPSQQINPDGEFYSSCHSIANKPPICYSYGDGGEYCYPDPENENVLNISTAEHMLSGSGHHQITGTVDLRDSTRGTSSMQEWLGVRTPVDAEGNPTGASPYFDLQMNASVPVHVIIDPDETEASLLAKLNAIPNVTASVDHNWVIPDVLDPITGLMVPGPGPAVDIGTGALTIRSSDGSSPITIQNGGGVSDGTGAGGLAAGTPTLTAFMGTSPVLTPTSSGMPPNFNNCPLIPGQTYWMNVQNEGTQPINVNVGFGKSDCPSVEPAAGTAVVDTGGGGGG